jgi:hypothetical protein
MKTRTVISASLVCILLAFLCTPQAYAQVSEKEKKEQEQEKKLQLEKKTYALLEETANGAPGLKLTENRFFILTTAADLIWDRDQTRARGLFWDALNALSLMAPPAKSQTNPPGSKAVLKAEEQGRYLQLFSLRQDLLRRVALRDPQLALDMLRHSRQPLPDVNSDFNLPDDRELEQQIASEAAGNDPERALALARESLTKGLSFQLFELLYRLNQKDSKLGTKFAGNIIEKLRAANLSTDVYGARIAISLLNFSRQPMYMPERTPHAAQFRQLKLDEEQRRELTELITNAALTEPANPSLLYDLSEVMAEIERFTPERIPLIQRKLAAFTQTLNKEQRISQAYNSLFRHGTPEEMLKLANQAGDDREWMQQQAVVLAVMRGRADAVREFARNEIDDEGRRRKLLDQLDTEQIDYAVAKGNEDELRRLMPQVRRKEERARAMVQIALVMEKKGNHDEALKLLDEAQTMIKTDLFSDARTNALLALITVYAQVEPTKAFGLVEGVIDRANGDVAKAVFLDKIVKSGVVKSGEIRLQNSGVIPIDFAVFKFGQGITALANADFERTKAAADRFERPELRLMARLMLAQALLRGNPEAVP